MLMSLIKKRYKRRKRAREWRLRNSNNSTTCDNDFDYDRVAVGNYTYGSLTVLCFGANSTLKIGSFCSIASGVVFNLAGDHHLNHISTFPFKAKALGGPLNEAVSQGNINVSDDVWIGQNAIIQSGVSIGQGAVIASGAVVTHDIPPYAVVAGMPAKIIKFRFCKQIIDYMLTLDYGRLNEKLIREHIDDLYQDIETMTLDELKSHLNWFPKK